MRFRVFSTAKALAAIGMCIGSAGCFSVKLDGEIRCDVSAINWKQDVWEVVSLDAISPEIVTNAAGSWIAVYAVGEFVFDDRPVAEIASGRNMSIGVLPSCVRPNSDWGFGMANVILKNAVYLGAPTLCGIFANPFFDEQWLNDLSFAAVVGVWRYGNVGQTRVARRLDGAGGERKTFRKVLLKDFALSVKAATGEDDLGSILYVRDQDGLFYIGRRAQGEEISFTFATMPRVPHEIYVEIPGSELSKEFKCK